MTELSDILNQITTASVGLLIVLGVVVLGYALKSSPLPNRFIPLAGLVVAIAGNVAMGDPGQCAPSIRCPDVQLAFVGLVYWGAAWALHAQVLKRFGLDRLLGHEPPPEPPPPPH